MNDFLCPVCDSPMRLKYRLRFRVYACPRCALQHSDARFEHSFRSDLDAGLRDPGLKQLRLQNFRTIIAKLKAARPGKLHGLEVGSGNGWWLEVCRQEDISCMGIEPEETYRKYHEEKQLDIRYGFYPQVRPVRVKGYDFIIFNDVFEHIPDVRALLNSLSADLQDGGLLIINIPMSTGFFYRSASLLYVLGISGPLERLWQFNFHSPHMNYFNAGNLKRLLGRFGFRTAAEFPLQSLDTRATKARIMSDKAIGKITAAAMALLLGAIHPLIRRSDPDIKAFFFEKQQD